ncbi:MAG: hypothetical protein MPL62_16240 [Alphaproteobacteria bacterium]|nr:hypothetical protein [Alphaproteobacteria bacterium]
MPKQRTAKQHFDYLCNRVWCILKLGKEYDTTILETTITDLMWAYLRKNKAHFRDVRVWMTKSSTGDEVDHGTDWEWWIGCDCHGWFRYAVQAKRVSHEKSGKNTYRKLRQGASDTAKQKYPGLKYQHEILRQHANNRRLKVIPLYAFYNYVRVDDREYFRKNFWHCKSDFDKRKFGVTLTPLQNVESALRRGGWRTFDDMHTFCETIPMRCLVCKNARDICPSKHMDVYFDKEQGWHQHLPQILRDTLSREDVQTQEAVQTLTADDLPRDLYHGEPKYWPKAIAVTRLDHC